MKQDLLGLKDLSAEQINHILDTAREMKKIVLSDNKKIPDLQGKTVVNILIRTGTSTMPTVFSFVRRLKRTSSAGVSAPVLTVRSKLTLLLWQHRAVQLCCPTSSLS